MFLTKIRAGFDGTYYLLVLTSATGEDFGIKMRPLSKNEAETLVENYIVQTVHKKGTVLRYNREDNPGAYFDVIVTEDIKSNNPLFTGTVIDKGNSACQLGDHKIDWELSNFTEFKP